MPTPRIAAVTGANKGIGLAIVRNLALTYARSPLNSGGPLTIYLTARSSSRGAEALSKLESDAELKKAGVLAQEGGDVTVKFFALDISDAESVGAFGEMLAREHPEGVDAVVNNAGIALQGFNLSIVHETLRTNYHGSLRATQTLLPLLRRGGRLVNVCSMAGSLSKYSPSIRQAFLTATANKDLAAVTGLMDQFTTAVAEGREVEAGFPSAAYAVSKAGEIAATKVVAGLEAEGGGGRLVNACCPGYVRTDMTRGGGVKTVDEGARTPVMLALGEFGGGSGGFWQGEREIEW